MLALQRNSLRVVRACVHILIYHFSLPNISKLAIKFLVTCGSNSVQWCCQGQTFQKGLFRLYSFVTGTVWLANHSRNMVFFSFCFCLSFLFLSKVTLIENEQKQQLCLPSLERQHLTNYTSIKTNQFQESPLGSACSTP